MPPRHDPIAEVVRATFAMRHPKIGATQKVTLVVLATYLPDIHVSAAELAAGAKVARRTITSAVRDLESLGLITREPSFADDGGRAPNRYKIHLDAIRALIPTSA